MLYQEFPPSPVLRRYISHFQILEIPNGFPQTTKPLLPFLGTGLVFIYKKTGRLWYTGEFIEKSVDAPMSFLTPPLNWYYDMHIYGGFSGIACILRPGVFKKLFKIPTHYITNTMFTFDDLELKSLHNLYEQLADIKSPKGKISLIETYLKKLIYQTEVNKSFDPFLDRIHQVYSFKKDVRELSNNTCYSERQFNRKFKDYFGFSPKLYARIDRFFHARNLLNEKDIAKVRKYVNTLGYSNLSHFNKDFKQFSGMLPKEYFKGDFDLTELLGFKYQGIKRKIYLT